MTVVAEGMNLTDWHHRYLQQAGWTRNIRQHLFSKAGLQSNAKVLEVGCGTGAVMSRIANETQYNQTGIDIDYPSLVFAQGTCPQADLAQADGHLLPFADASFDAVYCHYLLLWVDDSRQVLAEMRRVTKPSGVVIALAEPDHAARIDAPSPLDELGRLQTAALAAQGANIWMGRLLSQYFQKAGLEQVVSGLLGAEWSPSDQASSDLEWDTVRSDLADMMSKADLSRYQAVDQAAWKAGTRVLFVPTFYAMGVVP
ncbi:MAG: class I SAM-dependent methyltransferase [Anaerolineaceae bacterium]|nr:class I SAM-dependent methyltransferase [Anaerolineaceae bacterium]